MSQLGLFYGEKLKQHGLAAIEKYHGDFLSTARYIARLLAERNGKTNIDEVRDILEPLGLQPQHSNVYGQIFRNKEWHLIGHAKSTRPSNHARPIKVWSLDGPEKLTCQPPDVKHNWRDREYYRPGRA